MTIRTTFAAAAIAALVASPGLAETWDMPTPYPEAEFHTQNVRMFVEDVAEATDGALTINVHSAQSLFKHPEIKRAVQTGQVQIAEMLMANLLNENAIFGVDAVPFLASSYPQARKLWDAQRPHVEAALEADGLMLLYAVPWPGQGFYTKEPLEGPEDLEGTKFRTYNAATARMAELMGAEPTIVEAVEIPQAFSTGVVDAMVTSGATGVRSKAWDFSEHFYDLNAWLPKNMIFVNRRAFMQLPEDVQTAVLNEAQAAEARGWEMSEEIAGETSGQLAENGMTVSDGSEALVARLQEIGDRMTAEWLESAGETGEAILEDYRAE
ncbi:MAG TPA: TRAP transporter substrate-binding protein [Paracoccaceae bacterium]|nr:TRAP transporter substrate-binding protein [Paracoccaceae bacterium]